MNEPLQCFQSQGEFTKSKRSFSAKTSALEPLQVFGQRVFGPVGDPEVFSPSNLNGRLSQSFPFLRHKLERFYHHALAAACRQCHRLIRPLAPFRKLLIKRVLLGHHAVPERLKQFSDQSRACPGGHNRKICRQWDRQISQFLSTFATSRHCCPKCSTHRDAEERRKHIRPIVHILIERPTLMLPSLTTDQPYRIDIE